MAKNLDSVKPVHEQGSNIFQLTNWDSPATSLLLEAERHAQRISSYARIVMALIFAIGFSVLFEPSAPRTMIVAAYVALASYFLIGMISLLLARPQLFRPWFTIVLMSFDTAVYVFVVLSVLNAVGVPPSQFDIAPAFLLIFVLISLSGLTYRPASVLILVLQTTLIGLAIALAGREGWLGKWWEAPGLQGPSILLGGGANLMRLLLIVVTALLTILAIHRSRRLLVRAIEMTQTTANLSRYFPRRIADVAAAQGLMALSRGRLQHAAIIFADVRNFTALSERMEPTMISNVLTELRALQVQVVEQHDGIIDKFIGDCAMAVFGVPEPSADDAGAALAAALAMLESVSAWNAQRVQQGLPRFDLGIGIHYGEVFAGIVGGESRLEYTVLGDSVNLAERVERLSRQLNSSLVITESVLDAASADKRDWEDAGAMAVKGRNGKIRVYCFRDKQHN